MSAPVEGQRFLDSLPGLLEALQRGKRGAERPQRFGRGVARVASCAFDRAPGEGERRVGVAAGERHPSQPGENRRPEPILVRIRKHPGGKDQQRLGIEPAAAIDMRQCQCRDCLCRRERLRAERGQRDLQRPPAQRRLLREIACAP